MAHLFGLGCGDGVSKYLRMRRHKMGEHLWAELVEQVTASRTLYVGNLSFFTTEEQLYEFFEMVGPVHQIVMGLNKESKTPCGFCFVEFYEREHAIAAVNYLSGMKVDERAVKLDIDQGFSEGRQYGRGRSGGQVRDEVRTDFDYGRGGWGKSATVREEPDSMNERVDEVPVETSTPVKKQDNHRFREGRDSDEDD